MSPAYQRADRTHAKNGIVVLLVFLGIALTGLLAVSPAVAQDPGGQGAVPPVTTHQLLDGPTTAAPVPTTAAPNSVSRSGPVTTKSADTKKVWGVVATLVLVAVCLLLLTLLYVRRTQPDPPQDAPRPQPSSPPARARLPQDQPRSQPPPDAPRRPPDAQAAPGARTAGSSRVGQVRMARTYNPGGDPNRVRTAPSGRSGPAVGPSGRDARTPLDRRQPPPRRRNAAPAEPRRSAG